MSEPNITFRVTQREKEKIKSTAKRCGLSTSEYVKQRALGYEPKQVPPGALFSLIEKIGELGALSSSPETDSKICGVLSDITDTILSVRKED